MLKTDQVIKNKLIWLERKTVNAILPKIFEVYRLNSFDSSVSLYNFTV